MIFLTLEEIISLHSRLIHKTGGLDGVRDFGLLESALASCQSSFAEVEQYPTLEEKAARLAFSLTNNHAFLDGNKRIAVLVMLTTLQLNGISLKFTQHELITLGLSLADGSYCYKDVLKWVREHK